MKRASTPIKLKSGQKVSTKSFLQDQIQMIRKKDWKTALARITECDSIPDNDPHIIELFLRFSRTQQIRIVDALLKRGIDVNCSLNGQSALSLAIELANAKMIAALVQRGADVNMRPYYATKKEKGHQPLFSAILEASETDDSRVRKTMTSIIQCLIGAGAVISGKREINAVKKIIQESECDELKSLLPGLELNAKGQIAQTKIIDGCGIASLIGKYKIDVAETIKYKYGRAGFTSEKEQKKCISQFRSQAKLLQCISLEITKNKLIISSPDGIEQYPASCKAIKGQVILNVEWGIPTPFIVRQIKDSCYHFDREGNTISEVVWKKI